MPATPQTSDAANQSPGHKNGWSAPERIQEVLDQVKGNKTKAAEILGVSRASLRHRLAEIGAEKALGQVFESPFYSVDILRPENWNKPRPCWHCGASIIPMSPQHWEKHFCNADHSREFHRYGHLSFDAFMLNLKLELRREIKHLVIESFIEQAASTTNPAIQKFIRDCVRKSPIKVSQGEEE